MKARLLCAALAIFLTAAAATAQTSRGTVSGVVTDPNGAVVVGASVALTNQETRVARNTVTNSEGFYRFDAVDPGTYTIVFSAQGFDGVTKTNVPVLAAQTADVGAQMTIGQQQVSIDVTAEGGVLLQTDAPVRGGSIERRRVVELPVATRNPANLALTLPGVSSNRAGFGVQTFSVNGARGRSNNFLIDGTENNDISVAGQGFQITNPDAVQEVAVQTSNFDAEFGRAGGAVVNVVTRGGTNDYRGTLSYLLDSTRDDAITGIQSRDPQVQMRGRPLPGTEQWFAGTFGGPVVRNRTFFFGSFQHQRQLSTGTVRLTTPSAAGRATLRQVFAQGASRNADLLLGVTENAVANSSFFNVALGARPGCPAPCNVELGSFFRSYPAFFRDNQFQIRLDHQLGPNDQLSARYLFDDQINPTGSDVSFEGFDSPNNNRYQNFLIAETHVFSPRTTNELRLAYNRLLLDFPVSGNNLAQTLPQVTIAGVRARQFGGASILGVASNLPQGRVANNYLIQETMTHVRGNHTFRFGGEFVRQISRQSAPFNSRGTLVYNASTGFSGFANFVDDFGGSGGSATLDFGSPVYFPKLYRTSAFFQDRWQASPSLSLTLGLRYEFFGTPFNNLRTPAFTGLFNIDPVTRTGPFSEPNKVRPDKNNFGPAVGFAWSPSFTEGLWGAVFGDRLTVVRGGYQIGYDSFFNNIASNAQSSSPNIVSTQTTSTVDNGPRGRAGLSQSFPTTARPVDPRDAQTLVSPNLVNPYYQRWSLGMQRSLPFQLMLDASYVGSKGTKLYSNEDYNPLVPAALRVTPAGYTGPTTNRLDNLQGTRTVRGNSGLSNYHSGQFQLQRRFANSLTFTGSYTWSKLIDNGSEVFATAIIVGGSSLPQVPFILGGMPAERAVSLFDRPHRGVFSYVYELPFMREQKGPLGRLLGGWQVAGVTTFESGVPYTVTNGVDSDGLGGAFPDRPDFNPAGAPGTRAIPFVATAAANVCGAPSGTVFYTTGPSGSGQCIDPAGARFIGLLANSGRSGNLGRNTERTPGTNLWNVNLQKRTRLTENTALEFRTEFFNIFNRPNYLQGSISPFSPTGGSIEQEVFNAAAGAFLAPNTASTDGGGRVIRYQLKFTF
ncbi:MAG TPA: carboxypeptidase regulatory-like domain-containing protein [Pyrinomonadaceae bacterium]|nr:carboxypeptidase regulatory-like domain-containing protein [Pyrinomonadaceae bacterium]